MALARLCLNRAIAGRAQALARPALAAAPATDPKLHSLLSTSAADSAASGEANRRDVAVSERSAPNRRWAWRDLRDFTPFSLVDGLGSALSQVAETLGRPLERLAPSRLLSGKVREDEARYRLRFEVPGLGKGDVRVAVEDGVLVIEGEKREHGEEGDGGEWWSTSGYHASLLLPDDARAEGITAEVKDGVLYVTVPRTGERKRNVTEVKVQ
ncbi:chloroplast small heat shock protein [Zea mays]|uniref:Chloroplast small heat shock protein n=1 Tax=Zea mays TaxID=4577 RepID=B6TMR8_MAIZE|nr:chloroplast small heat shock protein [Zea mays]ACG38401.1 chloroplast small heat shock protein [Zea mays]AQK69523.1 Chloroplast small heat shock protein [Zea mays]|eukprot:NP_001150256.1 chloroplast small heat shock protein [Zea mays]